MKHASCNQWQQKEVDGVPAEFLLVGYCHRCKGIAAQRTASSQAGEVTHWHRALIQPCISALDCNLISRELVQQP